MNRKMNKKNKRGRRLTEEEEAAKSACEGRVDEAADGEIKTGVPFGIQIVGWRDLLVLRH